LTAPRTGPSILDPTCSASGLVVSLNHHGLYHRTRSPLTRLRLKKNIEKGKAFVKA
jgi:hypothetical protein